MKTVCILVFLLFTKSCEKDYSSLYSYDPPEFADDGIQVGTLEEVGMDSQILAKVMGRIYSSKYDQVHSILIHKDGLLVFEEYVEGNKYKYDGQYHYGERIQWDKDSLHVIMSCTKSIVSACIGIAADKGFIKQVNEPIFKYLPDHQHYMNNGKEFITIQHLLTMSSGLEFDEWSAGHGSRANDIDRIHWDCQDDPLACVLERSLIHTPGEEFNYNSGGTIVLGEILRNASGLNLEEFAEEYLFDPLGIDTVSWNRFEDGVIDGGGELRMKSRDMLKIGMCFLNKGVWNEQRIISQEWIEHSKNSFGNNTGIKVPGSDMKRQGYGYSWWTGTLYSSGEEFDYYAASGWGGQKIFVIDELDLVVVFLGGNYVVKNHHREIMEQYVFPAISG
jgi:CubicO group peptidase (beta-lactamase class C family)